MLGDVSAQVLVMLAVVFALTEVFKPVWDPTKREDLGDKVFSAVADVGICILGGIDIFPTVGLPFAVPYVGSVLTGFLAVGGGKGLHDILGLVNATRLARIETTRLETAAGVTNVRNG